MRFHKEGYASLFLVLVFSVIIIFIAHYFFPNFKIHYMYCLYDWFQRDEYKSVLNYLKDGGIHVFWGNSEKEKIIEFIHNPL